jgi:hypothetical protein
MSSGTKTFAAFLLIGTAAMFFFLNMHALIT